MATNETRQRELFSSGIRRLDYILKGGFRSRDTFAIVGPPGSGKTILASQVCFTQAREARTRVVYFTLISESGWKIVRHLEEFAFYDPDLVGDRIHYFSAYRAFQEEGLSGLLEFVRGTLHRHRAEIVVMDGFESVQEGSSETEFREFVHKLLAVFEVLDCTGFLLSLGEEGRSRPLITTVDGVLELSHEHRGSRSFRELRVTKLRGQASLPGAHEVEITQEGIVVHPRTEIQFDEPAPEAEENRIRMCFGLPELDKMLGGGLLSGSTTTLLGAPGTGKTLLGLRFLIEGASQGQHGIYFGFYEPPPRLIAKAEAVGLPLRRYVDEGLIEIIWQPPLEHMLDSLAEQLHEHIREHQRQRRRVFIDGVEGFRSAAVEPDRLPRFMSALTNQLRMQDATTLFADDLGLFTVQIDLKTPQMATVVENVILLRYVEQRSQLYRLISIMKSRESAYDTSIREFTITASGIEIKHSFESAERILSGGSELLAGRAKKPKSQRE